MKFKADHKPILQKLDELKAAYCGKEHNADQYFNHPAKNYKETDEALRIREVNNQFEITYKGPKFNRESKARIEQNINIDNAGTFEQLLLHLGFSKGGRVEKNRLIWKYDNIKICLDSVFSLGEFVELELEVKSEEEMPEAIKRIQDLCTKFSIDPGTQILTSYLSLLEKSQ
ncbi:MAG: class IV adenylate cyclase [Candidatus Heimdallarchaeota archaeon]|nr:class IV adenylate cyclase [Candidatus Heimdallarchaeota archaeon]